MPNNLGDRLQGLLDVEYVLGGLFFRSERKATPFLAGRKLALHPSGYENSLPGLPSCADKCGRTAVGFGSCCHAWAQPSATRWPGTGGIRLRGGRAPA